MLCFFSVSHKTVSIGDEINLFIHLYTHDGKPKNRGGDLVKVLIQNTTKGAYCPGRVIDHKNGSYSAVVDALWEGNSEILAYVAYTREAITGMYRMRNEVHVLAFW